MNSKKWSFAWRTLYDVCERVDVCENFFHLQEQRKSSAFSQMNSPWMFLPGHSPFFTQSCMNQSQFLWMYLLFVSVSNRKSVHTARVNNVQLVGCPSCLIRVFQNWLKSRISSLWGIFYFFRKLTWVQLTQKRCFFFFKFPINWKKKCFGDIGKGCLIRQSNWGESWSDFSASKMFPSCQAAMPPSL